MPHLSRRHLLSAAATTFAAAGIGVGALGAPAGITAVQRHGRLAVHGTRIVDQTGAPVVLRGASLFWSQWGGKYYNRDVVRWLRDDWNANVVRAAIAADSGGWIANPRVEMAKARVVIDAAIEAGVYVIVDWHAHQPRAAEARRFFGEIARRYGDQPNLIYETYNEPLREHDWATVIKPYHEAVIPVIRAHAPENLIVAGTQTWSQDVDKAAANPLGGRNIAYTLHFYAGTHRQELRDKAQAALDAGVALFVTEWGTSEANGSGILDEVETRLWLDFLERNLISYANWSIIDKAETSAALIAGASARGGWSDHHLSPSGKFVRGWLRRMNANA